MYDLLIIGAGPAGLTASIYASCYRMSHIVLSTNIGGQMLLAPDILNYPGFLNITGKELTARMVEQVTKRGGSISQESVTKMTRNEGTKSFEIQTEVGKTYEGKAVLLASGTERKKLNVPGEMKYTGSGVLYCATCEKQDYEGKVCVVVGGANSALQAAVQLSTAASKVYIIYRGSELRGDAVWLDQIKSSNSISVLFNSQITEITGDEKKVTGATVLTGGTSQSVVIDKIFIEIGGVPGTALVAPLGIQLDKGGYIQVNEKMETSIPGLFAAGDLVTHEYSIEQISTAVGLGARAAASVFSYLTHEHAPTLWGESHIKRPAP